MQRTIKLHTLVFHEFDRKNKPALPSAPHQNLPNGRWVPCRSFTLPSSACGRGRAGGLQSPQIGRRAPFRWLVGLNIWRIKSHRAGCCKETGSLPGQRTIRSAGPDRRTAFGPSSGPYQTSAFGIVGRTALRLRPDRCRTALPAGGRTARSPRTAPRRRPRRPDTPRRLPLRRA